jgi:circadian clock protein KaiC
LVSGSSGTGKTSIAAHFADETCRRKEKCLFVALEESPKQILRNMKSIGLDLDRHVKSVLLEFQSFRPGLHGLEMHLASLYKMVRKFKPQSVVVDPITNLVTVGLITEVNAMLLRLIDFMQSEGITLMLTALNSGSSEHIDENVSSLVDAWILVRDLESDGERNRAIYIMKSRGMQHSNEVREFLITSKGLDLVEVYRGPNGVLVGSARKAKMREGMAFAKKNQRKHFNKPAKKIPR